MKWFKKDKNNVKQYIKNNELHKERYNVDNYEYWMNCPSWKTGEIIQTILIENPNLEFSRKDMFRLYFRESRMNMFLAINNRMDEVIDRLLKLEDKVNEKNKNN